MSVGDIFWVEKKKFFQINCIFGLKKVLDYRQYATRAKLQTAYKIAFYFSFFHWIHLLYCVISTCTFLQTSVIKQDLLSYSRLHVTLQKKVELTSSCCIGSASKRFVFNPVKSQIRTLSANKTRTTVHISETPEEKAPEDDAESTTCGLEPLSTRHFD